MAMGEFRPSGYYDRNTDGSLKLTASSPTFHSEPSKHQLVWPCDASCSAISKASWFSLSTGWGSASVHVWYIGQANGGPVYLDEADVELAQDTRYSVVCPEGTQLISVLVKSTSTDNPIAWCLEVAGQ
ncbi:hypothetical protein [Kutzneria albida]|uniref:Uncharacterized protein n=1 Tax=Kutzneria albida DSM 43870 TaxID=1449976 RepID=W5WBS4_9PSEU|nr:hypothetical protein [Kutzneria albida]AHH98342.1 hypothetical protein KALB_4980 [Kutzneria albida DSM 43870]